jgi:hypothetical protein
MSTEQPSVPAVVMRLFDVAREGAWLDAHQAGIYISACAATIRRACKDHKLKHVRVGHSRGPILTRAEWIDAWMMQGAVFPAGEVAGEPDDRDDSSGG